MASEIRANKQTNRVGLGTVTYTDTGIIVSGIVTANSFKGDGSSLTGIDATALKDTAGDVKIQANTSGAVHSGISTFNEIKLDNTKKIKLGTSSNLQIYHGSNVSHIAEDGTGPLRISTDEFQLMNVAQNKTMIYAAQNLAVSLNYNGNTKFQTTNTGAIVTGVLTAHHLVVMVQVYQIYLLVLLLVVHQQTQYSLRMIRQLQSTIRLLQQRMR